MTTINSCSHQIGLYMVALPANNDIKPTAAAQILSQKAGSR